MTAKYYVTLTDYGATLVAQAHDVASIALNQMVIGDADGIPYDPIDQKGRTALVNQKASVPVQSVVINGAVTTVTATITANIGGFNLHEIGLKDSTGQLVYIGNYHGGYKPIIAEGAGGELTIVIDITSESGKEALIEIDQNVVTANKEWVIDNFVRIPTFEDERAARISAENLLNEKVDLKFDKAGGTVTGETTFNYQVNFNQTLWLYSPYDDSTFVIGYENEDTKDILFSSNPITNGTGNFKFNNMAMFSQGLVATSLDVRSYGVNDNTSLEITTQGSYSNFRMTDSTGNPDTNPLFVFEGRLQSKSSFLGTTTIFAGDVTSERSLGTVYINDSPRPRVVNVTSNLNNGATWIQGFFSSFAGGFILMARGQINSNVSDGCCNITFIVPPGYYYKVEGSGLSFWSESF